MSTRHRKAPNPPAASRTRKPSVCPPLRSAREGFGAARVPRLDAIRTRPLALVNSTSAWRASAGTGGSRRGSPKTRIRFLAPRNPRLIQAAPGRPHLATTMGWTHFSEEGTLARRLMAGHRSLDQIRALRNRVKGFVFLGKTGPFGVWGFGRSGGCWVLLGRLVSKMCPAGEEAGRVGRPVPGMDVGSAHRRLLRIAPHRGRYTPAA